MSRTSRILMDYRLPLPMSCRGERKWEAEAETPILEEPAEMRRKAAPSSETCGRPGWMLV
jgi:hypothetical protein